MAGIQRFITYIYAYEEGKKGANKGFAKIEIRGNDCRMEIHIKDIRKSCQTGEVFLFREKDGKLESISIGEMKLMDGRGDYGFAFKTEGIKDTVYAFRDIEGVLILIADESICLSRWKEGNPIDVRLENVKQPTAASQNVESPVSQPSDTQTETKQQDTPSETEPVETEPAQPPHEESAAAQEIPDAPEWQENIQATEVPMRNVFPQYQWLEVWEELQKSYPSFLLHQEKEIPCVRIELKDLRELPQKYWCFGNNSFLLHGFFNYRYLIIGRLEVDRWFIGVPGIYQPQERVMAAIFGFTEFLPQDEAEDKKTDKFGYWYHVF